MAQSAARKSHNLKVVSSSLTGRISFLFSFIDIYKLITSRYNLKTNRSSLFTPKVNVFSARYFIPTGFQKSSSSTFTVERRGGCGGGGGVGRYDGCCG